MYVCILHCNSNTFGLISDTVIPQYFSLSDRTTDNFSLLRIAAGTEHYEVVFGKPENIFR